MVYVILFSVIIIIAVILFFGNKVIVKISKRSHLLLLFIGLFVYAYLLFSKSALWELNNIIILINAILLSSLFCSSIRTESSLIAFCITVGIVDIIYSWVIFNNNRKLSSRPKSFATNFVYICSNIGKNYSYCWNRRLNYNGNYLFGFTKYALFRLAGFHSSINRHYISDHYRTFCRRNLCFTIYRRSNYSIFINQSKIE
jgi:hypothetical protein